MKFLDEYPLVVVHQDHGTWLLYKEMRCISDAGEAITIPAGFETDFASIPRFLWGILSPTGQWGKAAIVHDWLYDKRIFDRKKCDDLFLEGMADLGVGRKTRITMYAAVRAFGKRIYET